MPKRGADAKKKGAGDKQGKDSDDLPPLKAQEWTILGESDATTRISELRAVEEVVSDIHRGDRYGSAALRSALSATSTLQGPAAQELTEVNFSVLLVNEPALDRDKKDALIVAVAKDLAGDDASGPLARIDTKLPNSDVRIASVVEVAAPEDPTRPEVRVDLRIVAENKAHAETITNRIKELIVERGGQQSWPTLAHKMAEELIPDDGVDHKPDELQSRLVDTLLLPEPITLTPMSTPFIVHTTQAETTVPTPQNSLKVLMIGGRDPYKNDLARWFVGMEPQQRFNCKKAERPHCFTVVGATTYASDFRGFKIACRMGDVDKKVRDALQTSFASVAQSMSSAAGSEGKLSKAQFHEAFSGLELNLGGGSTMRLTQSQIDDLFSQADIDGDGVISRTEFLTAFKGSSSGKGMDMAGMEQAGARSRKLALGKQAGEENESNQNKLDDLQTGLKEIGGDVKSLQELAKRKEAEAKEKKKAEDNMKKFNVLADAAKKKADSAKAKIAASKSVLEGGTADAKEIKKAQQAMVDANKDLLEAKKQLESAQVQHDAAVAAVMRGKSAMSGEELGGGGGSSDTVDSIEEKIRKLIVGGAGGTDVQRVFDELDVNGDGRLTTKEFKGGIEDLLQSKGVPVKPGLIDQLVAYLDVSGDGYIDYDEFLAEFDGSDYARILRAAPSISDLPCLACYQGGASVLTFPESGARESELWRPRGADEQAARGKLYDARIGKRVAPGKYRITFAHKREDPGAKQTGLSERVLYNKFADFPDPMYSITQVCSLSDVRLHHGIKSQEALERLGAFRVDIMRVDLINEISSQLRRRVPNGNRQAFQKMETAINSALAFGSREAVLNGSKDASGADGLITVWDTWCSAPVHDRPGMPEARLRAEAAQTRYEISVKIAEIAEEEERYKDMCSAWGNVKGNRLGSSGPADMNQYVGGELMVSWGHRRNAKRMQIVLAPEIYTQNLPREEDEVDLMSMIRDFFPDHTSKLSLDKQIRKRFEEMDADRSGGLDRREFKNLIRATVNKQQERLTPDQIETLAHLLDYDRDGTVQVEELVDCVMPRGGAKGMCPYDSLNALELVAATCDRIIVLVDPHYTRFNAWEKVIIRHLHSKHARRMVFANFVTAEVQDMLKTPGSVLSACRSAAEDLSHFIGDEAVGRELSDNIIMVGSLIDYTQDREGTMKTKSTKGNPKWKQLPNSLSRFLVSAFSVEARDATELLAATRRSISCLSAKLLKSWRLATSSSTSLEPAQKDALAKAATSLSSAADVAMKRCTELEAKVRSLPLGNDISDLRAACKAAKKASKGVLVDLQMDDATKKDREERDARLKAEKAKIEASVRKQQVAEWTTHAHIVEWQEQVASRHALDGTARSSLRALLEESSVQGASSGSLSVSSLLHVDPAKLPKGGRGGAQVTCEINKVRSAFWSIKPKSISRNLWLLARENFVRMEDVKLFYNLLNGQVAVPGYWKDIVVDSLELLTAGLLQSKPLSLVKVVSTQPGAGGKERDLINYYFTDGEDDPLNPGQKKRGRASANAVAEALVHLRRDVCETLGWRGEGDEEDTDEDEEERAASEAKVRAMFGAAASDSTRS